MAKVTKRERFEAILAVLEGVDEGDLAEFVKGELALLAKRASGSRKLTKAQVENEGLKFAMVGMLDEPKRATEVAGEMGVSVQKATALLGQLVKAGLVARVTDGKVTRFTRVA